VADRIAVLDHGRIQQIGAPAALYDHPANRFVATFLGTANLIDGRIENGNFSGGGLVLGGVAGLDGPACISVRPQDVALGAPGLGTAATVETYEFLGGVVRYRLRMGSQDSGEQRIVVDAPHRRDQQTHAVGSAVGVTVDPRQIAVLR
jgi:iron(III) transport system ATP-binding protein